MATHKLSHKVDSGPISMFQGGRSANEVVQNMISWLVKEFVDRVHKNLTVESNIVFCIIIYRSASMARNNSSTARSTGRLI